MARFMFGRSLSLTNRHMIIFGISALLLWTSVPPAFGSVQEKDETLIKTDRRLPMLNGHRFVLSSIIKDPFVSSFVGTSTGFGAAPDVNISLYDFDGEPFASIKGDLAYMRLGLQYRQAFTDWLSLWVDVHGLGRMGINPESIFSQGITGNFGLELGGLGRLWHTERLMLSASASYQRGKYYGVDILTFVQRIILEGGIAPDNKLTKRIATDRFGLGLHFAYAFTPCFGLMASAELGTTDSIYDPEERETLLTLAGLASLDLNPRTGVPLGFNLGLNYTSYPEGADDLIEHISEALFKVAYTGRREFSIALEGSYLRAPLRFQDDSFGAWTGQIALRYFF